MDFNEVSKRGKGQVLVGFQVSPWTAPLQIGKDVTFHNRRTHTIFSTLSLKTQAILAALGRLHSLICRQHHPPPIISHVQCLFLFISSVILTPLIGKPGNLQASAI